MTLANVAWALATNGERVLAIDWDLEAPGLHRYFHPFLSDPDQSASAGLIDRIWDYVSELGREAGRKNRFKLADCNDIVQELELPVGGKGCLHFIGAGQQNERYSEKVGGLDWNGLYARFDGETFISQIIKWAREHYTHILIDSRTGVADTAGICTAQVPDALVLCLVYNRQSIEGTAAVAQSIVATRKAGKRAALRMEFVPSRVEERSAVEAARRHTAQRLIGLIDDDARKVEQSLRRAEVRNYPWCAFEEKLAVFEEFPDERGSLLDAMHDLARRLTASNHIQIKSIDPERLNFYWRRAAFDDPRLFDLRMVAEQSTLDGWKQIQLWLDEAEATDDERPEWLMALAETAMSVVSRRDNRLTVRTGENFANAALHLARKAYLHEPRSYWSRLSLVLDDMAAFHQRAGSLEVALGYVSEAAGLWRDDATSTGRWRRARLLERRANILSSLGRRDAAIDAYTEMVAIYRRIGRRGLPAGSELEPARAQRLLARKLMEQGHWLAALESINVAMKMIGEPGPLKRDRDVAEIIDILTTRLQIAVHTEDETFDRVAHTVLRTAGRILPGDGERDKVLRELFLCQSELLARQGQFNEALLRIESTPIDFQQLPRVVLQRADTLLNAGRESEAAELLIESVENGAPLTEQTLDLFRRVLASSEHAEQYFDALLSSLSSADEKTGSKIVPTIRTLTDKIKLERKDVSQLVPLLQMFIRKAD
ncbi:CpsD/CapB family tyrosine-protein kinase [Rhizobium laguerreae]|nr:CpsD/CapB family tyrosine-protein kinase [Rhizobium laguerreae]